jgi:23S rRNA pseudouridine2605 synthase
MVRHTNDNDKKPRPRQGDRKSGPRDGAPRPGKSEPAAEAPKRSERIAKAMARAGIASRREVERLIGLGKVAVNGKILDTPAVLVTRDDVITVDGKPIGSAQATRVWRHHKPAGLVTSHKDPQDRPTVFDALPAGLPRVISVGRLDLNTEGLLLLTNDGELSRALELPSTELVRQYRARARGRVTQAQLDGLKDGVTVDGVRYGPIEATLDKAKEKPDGDGKGPANLWISVSIAEGKNREVRKVLEHLGLSVNRLIRLAYGPFQLGTLPVGAVEEVGPRVIRELLAAHIRPENLPTGNEVQTPAPMPGRRSAVPIVRGNSGSALSDPSRKPSRTRAAVAAQSDAADRAARPAKKAGWAKAAPRPERPKRTFKPRDGAPSEDRPRHFTKSPDGPAADRPRPPASARRPEGDAKAKRPYTPRDGAPDDRPKRPFKPREGAAASDRPKRDFKPRDGAAAADRPKRDFKPRPAGAGPANRGRPGGGGGRPAGGGGKPSGPRGPRKGG